MFYNRLIFVGIILIFNPHFCNSQDNSDFIKVIDFKASKCADETPLYRFQERIISKVVSNDISTIKIGVITNCAFDKIGSALLIRDTLHLSSRSNPTYEIQSNGDTTTYYMETDCVCAYDLTYKLPPIDTSYAVIYQGKQLFRYPSALRDNEYKIIGVDSLINCQEYSQDCYRGKMGDSFVEYCYYDNGNIKSIFQTKVNDDRMLSIYTENGDLFYFIFSKQSENVFRAFKWSEYGHIEQRFFNDIKEYDWENYYFDIEKYF